MRIILSFISFFLLLSNRIYNAIIINLTKVNIKRPYHIKGKIKIWNKGKIKIGQGLRVNSGPKYNPIGGDTIARLIVQKGGNLEIGDNFNMSNSTIFCTNKIIIGKNVFIGGGCKIWDTNFHSIDPNIRVTVDNDVRKSPVFIGDNAFIGASSIILKGVNIGENSILGAGSVLSKNIPKNEIWGGNPARKIKDL